MQSFMQELGLPGEEVEQVSDLDDQINSTAVTMNHQQRAAFITDIARKIDEWDTIALRWGFCDEAEMAAYINSIPGLLKLIKEERAIWHTNESTETRARELARRSTAELVPAAANIALNETITPSVRLDAVRTLARIGGLDSPGRAQETYPGAEGAARFSVNIHLGADKTVTIAPATIEPDPEH